MTMSDITVEPHGLIAWFRQLCASAGIAGGAPTGSTAPAPRPGVSRRGFLAALAAAGAGALAAEVDVDRLLWVPGEKTFFLPPVVEPWAVEIEVGPSFVSGRNTLLTADWYAREALLRVLKNRIEFTKRVTQDYDAAFAAFQAERDKAHLDLMFREGMQWSDADREQRAVILSARTALTLNFPTPRAGDVYIVNAVQAETQL